MTGNNRRLAISAMIGILAGYLVGRFVSMLPLGWGIVIGFMGCTALFTWTFYTLRELREHKRIIDDLTAQLEEAYRNHVERANEGMKG